MSSSHAIQQSLAVESMPGVPTQASNKASTKQQDTRIQPWMAFANPGDQIHSNLIAEAKSLSVIGLEKAELLIYAAENR